MYAQLQKKEDAKRHHNITNNKTTYLSDNEAQQLPLPTYKQPAQLYATAPSEELRSKSSVIQRYKMVDSGKYTQKEDKGKDARAPFTRFEEDISLIDKGKDKAMESGWKKHLDKLPPLKVANDNTLAINATNGEPKEFYATTEVISNANNDLTAVGSPIVLNNAGNEITLPDKKSTKVVMVNPTVKGKKAPGVNDFASLNYHICRDAAKDIMGDAINHLLLKGKDGPEKVNFDMKSGKVVTGPHALAELISKGDVSTEEAKKAISEEKPSLSGGIVNYPQVGEEYGKASRSGGEVEKRAEDLGINENAWSKVGQGYVTQSIFDKVGTKKDYSDPLEPTNAFVWGYHFSAVVAESIGKEDQIAMENYNRESDIKASKTELLNALKIKFAKEIKGLKLDGDEITQIGKISEFINKKLEVIDKDARLAYSKMWNSNNDGVNSKWYFRIIGKGKGESFHEQMASSSFFVNPMTFAVGNLVEEGATSVSFDEGSSTLGVIGTNNIKKIVLRITSSIHQGFTPKKIRMIGYGNGWKGTGAGAGKKGDERAQAVYDYFKDKGVPTNIMSIEKSPGKLDKSNPSVNRKVIVVIEN